MSERPHKKLKLWEKVMTVIEDVYHMTDTYPKQESYGLSMQMRRAAVSIASNIAEGAARKGKQEKIRFYSVARGSLSELDAQLEISARLKYVTALRYGESQLKLDEVSRMLQGMINAYKEPQS
jgi:four helix bundle protein